MVKLNGVDEQRINVVEYAAHQLATDPDYLAEIVHKMPEDMVRRMASRLSFEENKRWPDVLRREYLEKEMREIESARVSVFRYRKAGLV